MLITNMDLTDQQKREISHSKVEVRVGSDCDAPGFKVNGVEMGHIVGPNFEVEADVYESSVTVKIFVAEVIVEGSGRIKADLPDEVVAALTAAGWIAPTD